MDEECGLLLGLPLCSLSLCSLPSGPLSLVKPCLHHILLLLPLGHLQTQDRWRRHTTSSHSPHPQHHPTVHTHHIIPQSTPTTSSHSPHFTLVYTMSHRSSATMCSGMCNTCSTVANSATLTGRGWWGGGGGVAAGCVAVQGSGAEDIQGVGLKIYRGWG